jgi:hypothetical protein
LRCIDSFLRFLVPVGPPLLLLSHGVHRAEHHFSLSKNHPAGCESARMARAVGRRWCVHGHCRTGLNRPVIGIVVWASLAPEMIFILASGTQSPLLISLNTAGAGPPRTITVDHPEYNFDTTETTSSQVAASHYPEADERLAMRGHNNTTTTGATVSRAGGPDVIGRDPQISRTIYSKKPFFLARGDNIISLTIIYSREARDPKPWYPSCPRSTKLLLSVAGIRRVATSGIY